MLAIALEKPLSAPYIHSLTFIPQLFAKLVC